ncbi:MAG: hypothetical protein HC889_04105 [Synechococcaceae cyanobacterium SM1_2_3]|nr:hypothetical protein [Synechococcaceae cyanobacterium SM1_2_3]
MSLNNLTIGRRLGLGFGTMSVLLMLLAALAWGVAHTLNQSTSVVMAEADKALKARGVSAAIDGIYLNMWSLIANKDLTEKQKNIAQIAGLRESYKKSMEELKAAISSETGQALLANVDAAIAAPETLTSEWLIWLFMGRTKWPWTCFSAKGRCLGRNSRRWLANSCPGE